METSEGELVYIPGYRHVDSHHMASGSSLYVFSLLTLEYIRYSIFFKAATHIRMPPSHARSGDHLIERKSVVCGVQQ